MTTGESLRGSASVRKLQTVLHAKAKEEPDWRFHALADKVWREDFLLAAWGMVRRNGGAAGVDGVTVADVGAYGVKRWVGELSRDLRDGTYKPSPVRQVLIPKKQPGKFRPLGIPCLRDRVAQTSAMLVLMPVFEADGDGGTRRTNRARKERKGTPQGAPISPLLSNIYMRRFILGWKALGYARRFGAEIVNYADDFCVLGKAPAAEMLAVVNRLMDRLKLPVNAQKTRCLRCPEESLEFLGCRIGWNYRPTDGSRYIGTRPAKASVQSICRRISEHTGRRYVGWSAEEIVERLNRTMSGWANYFTLGQVSPAYRAVDQHATRRLRQWFRRKHKVRSGRYVRFSDDRLWEDCGLARLGQMTRDLPWAKA